jgi:DNA repair exonuclease SbcCD ATPase subunit
MITFTKIRWKNILSTGNAFTEIDLTRSTNTLIVGQNGAGKSTILDAFTFVLFGKPFRKINKPNLLNSINQSNGVVEVEFTIGKREYKVIRGLKPNVFEIFCDKVLLNQDAKSKDYQEHLEKFILKLNYKSFTQVVILGSASFVPFMQLSAADRRTIIEDLLDIGIFSSMNAVVKTQLSELKDKQKDVDYEMRLVAEKIKIQKQNIEDHKTNSAAEIAKKREEIAKNGVEIIKLKEDITKIEKHVDIMLDSLKDRASTEQKSKKMLQIEAKFESNKSKVEKEIEFYDNNDNCPTCHQAIHEDHKTKSIIEKKEKLSEIEKATELLLIEIDKTNKRLDEITKTQESVRNHNSEVVKLNTQFKSLNTFNEKLLREIVQIEQNAVSFETDNTKLKELKVLLEGHVKDAKQFAEDKQYYEYASVLLKDSGIKTKIIKQYLPVMNKLINKYLTAMDFFVNFNLDENFEETIKSRHRDEFSYASFSEGEKMRIDLALLFTWRQVAKMKNSVNTNLLILDEVFDSSLDGVGTEEFLKLLNSLDNNTNVFVISHKGDQLFDKFRSVIKFEKRNNFSQVAK